MQYFSSERIWRWAQKAGFAIADQGLFSGSHFVVNLMLARWLTPVEFGAFAFSVSILLLVISVHNAIFTDPMMVFGSGRYRGNLPQYLGILLLGHCVVTSVMALILAAIAYAVFHFFSVQTAKAILALAVSCPFILLLFLLRRVFYIRLDPASAAVGGAAYLFVLVGSGYCLHVANALSPSSAFLCMGLSALITSLFFLYRLRPTPLRSPVSEITTVCRDHYNYCRWTLAAVAVGWLPTNIYYFVLPLWKGLAAIAVLKALNTVLQVSFQTNAVLALLATPLLSRRFNEDKGKMFLLARTFLILAVIANAVFYGFLLIFPKQILGLFYGARYVDAYPLLRIMGLLAISTGFSAVMGTVLRAMERPDRIFQCSVVTLVATLTIGIPLTAHAGVEGAIMANVIVSCINGISLFVAYSISMRQGSPASTRLGRAG